MADSGAKMADRAISGMNKELKRQYKQAAEELKKKLADFNKRHEEENARKLAQVAAGTLKERDYKAWLKQQVFVGEIWERKVAQATALMLGVNEDAARAIGGKQIDVFAGNHNAFAAEAKGITGVSFTMYDRKTVERLLKKDPQLLPGWQINPDKDRAWSQKKIQTAVTQGIIQGESVDGITKRLIESLCGQSESRMRTLARTAITEAQNAGRMDALHEAEDMGIRVRKKWLATMDSRTRDSHAELDGEVADVDEEFSNGLMYPGDPSGPPEEVYNCRCTLVYVYPDYE